MGIATRVSVSRDGNLTVFNLTSNHDALLIGKHGKILQSLQILAKAYANSILNTRMNIAVNVGDYHEKRKAYIVSLAHRAAERARGGETVYINDLQSNERKIVHTIIGQEMVYQVIQKDRNIIAILLWLKRFSLDKRPFIV